LENPHESLKCSIKPAGHESVIRDTVCPKRGTGEKKENKLEEQEKYEYTKNFRGAPKK
jgi:hypothetical protein